MFCKALDPDDLNPDPKQSVKYYVLIQNLPFCQILLDPDQLKTSSVLRSFVDPDPHL